MLKGPAAQPRQAVPLHGGVPRGIVQPAAAQFPRRSRRRRREEDSPAILQEQDTPPTTQEPEEQRRPVATQEVLPQPTPLWKRWQLWIAAAAVPLVVLAAVLAPIDRQAVTPVSSAGAPSGEGASAVSWKRRG